MKCERCSWALLSYCLNSPVQYYSNDLIACVAILEYHGSEGAHAVSYMKGTDLTHTFVMAGMDLGYKQVDYNAEYQLGMN